MDTTVFEKSGSRTIQRDSVSFTNVSTKLRDAFESFDGASRWNLVSSGDAIVTTDGNAVSASYLVISLSPLAVGGETIIEGRDSIMMPFDLTFGAHLSQRTDGQLLAIEATSLDTDPGVVALTAPTPVSISAMSQSATTLTVTTAAPHGLLPGMRVQISGAADSRFNYGPIVVATVPSTTQFTATSGPFGAIPSVTATPTGALGSVLRIDALGSRRNGSSMVFENTTVTNASFFGRSEGGSALPSGTLAGNHSTTIATTASVALVSGTAAYAFSPTSQYTLLQQIEALSWIDHAVDVHTTAPIIRYKRNQVVPNPVRRYQARIRAQNLLSMSRPVAQIVSAVKSGSAVATITTDVPHGLTVGDQIMVYGIRDQTNFANLTTATAVASVLTATTFTISFGASVTGTSYGGLVARINAGRLVPGIIPQVAQAIVRSGNLLTVTGNATWTGAAIGDYVQLVGVRDNVTGASLGVDGAYRVRDLATTALVLEPITDVSGAVVSPTGADIVSVNCGGGVLRRTDLRISYARVIERARLFMEAPYARPDQTMALPVNIANSVAVTATNLSTNVAQIGGTAIVTGGVAGTLGIGGTTAAGVAVANNPVQIGAEARTTNRAAATDGTVGRPILDATGRAVVKTGQVRQLQDLNTLTLTSVTETTLIAAVASVFHDIKWLLVANTSATAVRVDFRDSTGGAVRLSFPVAAGETVPIPLPETALKQGLVNTNWTAQLSAAVTDVRIAVLSERII